MKEADIIILAGQSNAVGVGHTACLSRHFSAEKIAAWHGGFRDIQINYFSHDKKSGGFVPVTTGCTERSKDTVGPELGIAERLAERFPGRRFFIVKCAFGGTSLYHDWLSPSSGKPYDASAYADQKEDIIANYGVGEPVRAGWCYNELVKITGESIASLEADGYSPRIRAFCWMQGEADACELRHSMLYVWRYDRLLADFGTTFAPYLSDCVYADAGISGVWPFHEAVNAAKADYGAAMASEGRRYVDTVAAGLTTENEPFPPFGEPDTYHYDSDCVIKLGKMFADAVFPV